MDQVGWGCASAIDITLFSRPHAADFPILARPPCLATANVAPVARGILARLKGPARVVSLVGRHAEGVPWTRTTTPGSGVPFA